MHKPQLGILATAFSALLLSIGAHASELGASASRPGPGGGGGGVEVPGVPTVPGGGGCYFAYHIRKIGPEFAFDGEEIRYKIFVTNIGNCDLRRIRVTDFLPEDTRFIEAEPKPVFQHDGKVVWELRELEEGERAVFEVKVRVDDDRSHGRDHPRHEFRIVNTGCAFTPWIGIRICDTATTFVRDEDDHHHPALN